MAGHGTLGGPVLIASRGEDLTKSEMKIFKKLSGRTVPHLPLAGQGGLRDTNSLQCYTWNPNLGLIHVGKTRSENA
jgi:hypothetical protein